ncbi:unnamed protein product, partial [Cyprideis torosa]
AFPTETVYGLGADAGSGDAVARIYAAKGRPSFNPLIVHVAELEAAKNLVIWSDQAEALASAFWPGPLTLVLPIKDGAPISKLVTAGLDTLAVRIPDAPLARRILAAFGGPVAAPSANQSGQISPVRAEHVLSGLGGKIEAVLDGGRCDVGLESSVLGLAEIPTLLRPGGITEDQISKVIGKRIAERHGGDAISAPGQLRSHYAPRATVRLNATEWSAGEARLGFGPVDCDISLSEQGDLAEAARNLFDALIQLDQTGAQVIAVSPIPQHGLGIAINDRLNRAAAERD